MSKEKRTSQKAFLTYLILGMLPSGIKFFLLPIYVNFLQPEDYGLLSFLNVVSASYGIIGCLQLNIAAGVNYFKTDDKEAFEKTIFSSSLVLSFISFLLFISLGFAFFQDLVSTNPVSFFPLGFVALSTAFLSQIHLVFFVFLRNKYSLRELSFYSVLLVLLSSGLQFILIVFVELSVLGSILGSFIATGVLVFVILFRNSKLLTFNMDRAILRNCLAISVPMIPAVGINWVARFGDRIILERILNLGELGKYTLIINIIGIATLILQSLSVAIRPQFYDYLEDIQKHKVGLERISKIYVLATVLVASLILLVGLNLSLIIQNSRYLSIVPHLGAALLILLPQALMKIPKLEMLYGQRSGRISIASLANAIVMVLLMVLLIPDGGILYAILALAAASFVEFFICYFSFNRSGIAHARRSNLLFMAASSISIFLAYWIGDKFDYSFNQIGLIQFVLILILAFFYAKRYSLISTIIK